MSDITYTPPLKPSEIMLIFNVFLTLVYTAALLYMSFKMNKVINLKNRIEEILFSWFLFLAIMIIIRSIANMVLHFEISSQVGAPGIQGIPGKRGYNGQNKKCH